MNTNWMTKLINYSVIACLLLVGVGCATAKLYTPNPIVVPTSVSKSTMRAAAVRALKNRGWLIEKDWEDKTEASVRSGSHLARIRVSYPGNQIKIQYLDSSDFKYSVKDGEAMIHRRYNHWVRLIEDDILASLGPKGAYSVVTTGNVASAPPRTSSDLAHSKTNEKMPVTHEGAVVDSGKDYY
ncbi:MAG: hypothetical protein KDD62_00225 [Bdellovibrionales bacterium]|nr:hypothetical protein [Bdellovibrionales bacterium]